MALPRWQFLIAAGLTAFCGTFQMIYHSSIVNLPEGIFMQFMNETNIRRHGVPMSDTTINVLWGWIVSINMVGCLIGCLTTPFLAERFGRRIPLLAWSNAVAIGSSLLMAFCQSAHSYELLAVGRFINGFGAGISSTILPIYLSECSPSDYRGLAGSFQNIAVNVETIFAFGLAMPGIWGKADRLPMLLGFGIVPAAIQMISTFVLPESPKYLYIKKKNVVAAEKSLRFWRANSEMTTADVKTAFHEFDLESEVLAQEVGFLKAIRVPYFRRIFLVCSVIMACQACSAVGPVFAYSTEMFLKLGFSQNISNICTNMVAIVTTVGSLIVAPFVERYSRRCFFFAGYVLLTLVLIGYALACIGFDMTGWPWTAYIALVFLFFYCIFYNIAAGLLTFILPSELAPQAIRSTVISVSYSVGWALFLISTFIFPAAQADIGSWSYFIYITPLIAGLIYLYKALPETGRKSVADVVASEKQIDQTPEQNITENDSGFWGDGLPRPSVTPTILYDLDSEAAVSENGECAIDRHPDTNKF